MKYDFDQVVPRRGSGCVKWDCPEMEDWKGGDAIPLWVADMDFKTAPCIVDALRRRVEHGVFGYTCVKPEYYDAVVSWFSRRHGWDISPDWIQYTTGVVPAMSAVIKALTVPGDKVIIQTPVYNCFFSSIRNNGCIISENPLKRTPVKDGKFSYVMDYEGLEQACSDPRAKILLLCNPHNPAGRVWTPGELERVGEICRRHGVTVVSDEIHCELVMPGRRFTPFASTSAANQECSITLNSPSKSFNIAGLQIANIVTCNGQWRKLIDKAVNINEICDVNPFGVEAVTAAYNEGEDWLEELNGYLYGNLQLLEGRLSRELPAFPSAVLEGTYLAWIDCSACGIPSSELAGRLLSGYGVFVNPGAMYGTEGFIRINLACPGSVLEEGLDRAVRGLKALSGR